MLLRPMVDPISVDLPRLFLSCEGSGGNETALLRGSIKKKKLGVRSLVPGLVPRSLSGEPYLPVPREVLTYLGR